MAPTIRTLPHDIALFTGRVDELTLLVTAVSQMAESGRAVKIITVDGMAGVGKTSFAIHAAHRLAEHYPDGQLFLDLHAHTPGQSPVTVGDALGALLLAIGIAAQMIPPNADSRAAMWRDRLVDKRILLVLDDAIGHEQIRPLLPSTQDCLVLITSRRRLAALDDAEPLTLGILPADQAVKLFIALSGRRAQGAGPSSVAKLVELCGYLPLAIGLMAGRLRVHSSWTVEHLVDRLQHAQDRLAEMRAENLAIAAAFTLSYRDLSVTQQRTFRRLGLHPGNSFDAYAVAAMDDIELIHAERSLEALYNDHLLDEPTPDRYRLHDLIRDYALALTKSDTDADNEATLDRLLDYYLQLAATANLQISRRADHSLPETANFYTRVPDVLSRPQALKWLEEERVNLGACVVYAAANSRHIHAIELASAMHSFLCSRGYWDQALTIHNSALTSARLTNNRPAQANALICLGAVQHSAGVYPEATTSLIEALGIFRQLGDLLGQANTLGYLGNVQYTTGMYPDSLATLTEALTLFRDLGDKLGQADILNHIGRVQRLTGIYPAATSTLTEALMIFRQQGDLLGQANSLTYLASVQYTTGKYPESAATLTEALALFRDLKDKLGQANALTYLGRIDRLMGKYPAATATLNAALILCQELGDRPGEAKALTYIGAIQYLTSDYSAAIITLSEAVALSDEIGDRLGRANALSYLGRAQYSAERYDEASSTLGEALAFMCEIGDRLGQAEVLNNQGTLSLASSGFQGIVNSRELHTESLRLAREVSSPVEEARALEGIGRGYLLSGTTGDAISYLRDASAIYERLRVSEAWQVKETLSRIAPP